MASQIPARQAQAEAFAAVQNGDRICSSIEAAFNDLKQSLANTRALINGNANGYFSNPDDLAWIDAQIAGFKARIAALGQ